MGRSQFSPDTRKHVGDGDLVTKRSSVQRVLVTAIVLGLAIGATATLVRSSPEGPRRVVVSVAAAGHGPPIPTDFIGLSYEVKDLPIVASLGGHGNLVSLLRSLGPGILRFGGVTADSRVAWIDAPAVRRPRWATAQLVPADLFRLARLARATGWRVLLTVNLAHYDRAAAADEARVAKLALGSALKAIAIGNEPVAFVAEGLRRGRYTYSQYRREIVAYRIAMAAAAPGVPIVDPDNEPAASDPRNHVWARNVARDIRPTLLTAHLYGASKCERLPPTAALLLSQKVHDAEEAALNELKGVSREYRVPVWIDETNDISCGGEPGVSDSFAGALWALDLLTRTLRPPFAGDAFHGFLQKPDGHSPLAAISPQALRRGSLTARPKWYALLLAHQVEGDQPLPARLRPSPSGVAVWAGRTRGGALQVIVDNEQHARSRPLLIELPTGARARSATILRLQGPSLAATSGVTLGGSETSPAGSWTPRTPSQRVRLSHGVLRVVVAPASAVLITTATG
jgi:hypothetical protein